MIDFCTNTFRLWVISLLKKLGIGVVRYSELSRLRSSALKQNDLSFLREISSIIDPLILLQKFPDSRAQLRQDLLVLALLEFKKKGYFVEFGATDGLHLSNTFLLESQYEWQGILSEPAKVWKKDLVSNRVGAIDTSCVWSHSGEILNFREARLSELSTADVYSAIDKHGELRKSGKVYTVETISLEDLLVKHNSPYEIDFLSIDTEGSEYKILSSFNFDKYKFKVITVEHNFTSNRKAIHDLLAGQGYIRILDKASSFEDWFVNEELALHHGLRN